MCLISDFFFLVLIREHGYCHNVQNQAYLRQFITQTVRRVAAEFGFSCEKIYARVLPLLSIYEPQSGCCLTLISMRKWRMKVSIPNIKEFEARNQTQRAGLPSSNPSSRSTFSDFLRLTPKDFHKIVTIQT